MNNTTYALILSSIAGASTLLGIIVIFFSIKEKYINRFICLSLSFSLTIMIGISITELIPESFYSLLLSYNLCKTIVISILTIFIGIFIFRLISMSIHAKNDLSLYKLGILNMLVLIIHNLPEGIATFMTSIQDASLGLKITCSIILHNIPEGIAIAVPIYYATKSKKKAIFHTFLSSIAEPIGSILTLIFFKEYITITTINIILLLVSGIMISLAINEIYPKINQYHEKTFSKVGYCIGITIILISQIIPLIL